MATKLYLKTKDIQKDELKQIVTRYGLVRNFEDKESYCFVDYFYESDARIAQVELDGQIINGCKLIAQFSKNAFKLDDISKEALPSQIKRIYVGNLNYKFSHQELHALFSAFGPINELIHKDTYALVEFISQQSATDAIIHLNELILKGETLKVDMQKSYDEVLCSTNRIFVGKLGVQIVKNDLIEAFGQFGFIEDITVKQDNRHNYAFIQYKNVLQASKAIKEMDGATIKECKIQVQEARSRGSQQHYPVMQMMQQNPMIGQKPMRKYPPMFMPDLRVRIKSRSRSKSREKTQNYEQLQIFQFQG